jgi:hypothetical protein
VCSTGGDDHADIWCKVQAEKVKQEGVSNVADGEGLFEALGGFLQSAWKLQTSIQEESLDRWVFIRRPVLRKGANACVVGQIKGHIDRVALTKVRVDLICSAVAIGSRRQNHKVVSVCFGDIASRKKTKSSCPTCDDD